MTQMKNESFRNANHMITKGDTNIESKFSEPDQLIEFKTTLAALKLFI